jgi:hypothetical protein
MNIPWKKGTSEKTLGVKTADLWALSMILHYKLGLSWNSIKDVDLRVYAVKNFDAATELVLKVFHNAVLNRDGKELRALADAVEYDLRASNPRLLMIQYLHISGKKFTHAELLKSLNDKGITYSEDGGRQLRRDMKTLGLDFKNARTNRTRHGPK